jgi:hypothetical protein
MKTKGIAIKTSLIESIRLCDTDTVKEDPNISIIWNRSTGLSEYTQYYRTFTEAAEKYNNLMDQICANQPFVSI